MIFKCYHYSSLGPEPRLKHLTYLTYERVFPNRCNNAGSRNLSIEGPCPLRETIKCENILTTLKKNSPERLNLFHQKHLWARENKSNFIRKFLSFFTFNNHAGLIIASLMYFNNVRCLIINFAM